MNFTILALLIIFSIGIYFRIIPYDNVQGLWNDEYVSWFISQKPLWVPFINGIFEQCHMPLYYIYLKLITSIFGSYDVILRLSSFIIGVLNIAVMFFVGNTKNKLLGLLCASFTAVSGILIYYSYEVRPYSLIFLFSALSLLYTLRLIDNPKSKYLLLYIISNSAILFTHTIGFIYVISNFIFVSHYLKKSRPTFTKNIIFSIGVFFLLLTPLIINIFSTISFSQWWSNYSFSKLLFMLTDMFSSNLVNLVNAPFSFISHISFDFFIFAIIPTVICLLGILNISDNNHDESKKLLLTAIIPVAILFLASILGKLVFLTKYNFEVYPVLIFLALSGLLNIKNSKIKYTLIIILFVLNTTFLFTKEFKQYFYKPESHALVAELLNNAKLNTDDIILFTYYPRERFSKYFDYSRYEIREIHKGNFFYYLTKNNTYKDAVLNGNKIYKNVYLANSNPHFNSMVESEFYQNLVPGRKIAVIFLDSVSMLSDVQINQIVQDDKLYKKIPQPFLIFSYVKNYLVKKMYSDLKMVKYEQNGDWSLLLFEKTNQQ